MKTRKTHLYKMYYIVEVLYLGKYIYVLYQELNF